MLPCTYHHFYPLPNYWPSFIKTDTLNITTGLVYPKTFPDSSMGPDGVTRSSADVFASLTPSLYIFLPPLITRTTVPLRRCYFRPSTSRNIPPSHACRSGRLDLWPSTVWMVSLSFDIRAGFGFGPSRPSAATRQERALDYSLHKLHIFFNSVYIIITNCKVYYGREKEKK